jgi:predicted signal transduction protein with EAL and GGDEF domain
LGCDEAQGYFIAKPMPGEALLRWWSANEQRILKLLRPESLLRRLFGGA